MKKLAAAITLTVTILTLCVTPLYAKQVSGDLDTISITPSVIRMDAVDGTITVQTNLKYSDAVATSVHLNGLLPYLVKKNSRGYLVAKFELADVQDMVSPPSYTLSLFVTRTDGSMFVASQTVTVVQTNMQSSTTTTSTATQPSTTYTYPQTTYTYPSSSYSYTYPQTTYTYPSTTYTYPNTTYTYPSTSYSTPTYVDPANPYVYTYNPYYP